MKHNLTYCLFGYEELNYFIHVKCVSVRSLIIFVGVHACIGLIVYEALSNTSAFLIFTTAYR